MWVLLSVGFWSSSGSSAAAPMAATAIRANKRRIGPPWSRGEFRIHESPTPHQRYIRTELQGTAARSFILFRAVAVAFESYVSPAVRQRWRLPAETLRWVRAPPPLWAAA